MYLFWLIILAVGFFLYMVLPFGWIPSLDRWAHQHEDLMIGIMFAPVPLSMLVGGLFGAFSEIGLGAVIIRRSAPLYETLIHCVRALRSNRWLLVPPIFAFTAVAGLLSFVMWQSVIDLPSHVVTRAQAEAYAVSIILRPQTILGYLFVGFILLF